MTRDEYKRKLIDKYPGLDKREPITFAHGDDVLRMLMQAHDIGWRQGSYVASQLKSMFGKY